MGHLQLLLEQANQALGRLDGFTSVLPLYGYVRKEALLSSQIEGTQSSLLDLLLFEESETPGVPIQDVQDVSNYVAALNHGMRRLRDGFPLSLRLIREIHGVLLSEGTGSNKEPGKFRRSQWIGGRTSSSNPSIHSSTATGVWAGFSSPSCCARVARFASRFCT
jgi:Fic family protein